MTAQVYQPNLIRSSASSSTFGSSSPMAVSSRAAISCSTSKARRSPTPIWPRDRRGDEPGAGGPGTRPKEAHRAAGRARRRASCRWLVLDSADHGGSSVAPAIASDGFTRLSWSIGGATPRPAFLPRGRSRAMARSGEALRRLRRPEVLLVHVLAPAGDSVEAGGQPATASGASAPRARRRARRDPGLRRGRTDRLVLGRPAGDLPSPGRPGKP